MEDLSWSLFEKRAKSDWKDGAVSGYNKSMNTKVRTKAALLQSRPLHLLSNGEPRTSHQLYREINKSLLSATETRDIVERGVVNELKEGTGAGEREEHRQEVRRPPPRRAHEMHVLSATAARTPTPLVAKEGQLNADNGT